MELTTVPVISTKKRRKLKPQDRKKTLFSCDHCKLKKVACRKKNPTDDKCIKCTTAGISCETTIQRKRRSHGPLENIGLHYKCLYSLVKKLCPNIDINDIDSLIEYGVSMNITMPSPYGESAKDHDESMDLAFRITSQKRRYKPTTEKDSESPQNEDIETSDVSQFIPKMTNPDVLPLEHMIDPFSIINFSDFPVNTPDVLPKHKFRQPDCIVIDKGGNIHYVGRFGGAGCLETCINIMINQSSNFNLWSDYSHVYNSEIVMNSQIENINFKSIDFQKFPLINKIPKSEMDFYLDRFFARIHPRNYCFNESKLRSNYQTLWNIYETGEGDLGKEQVCCIYMITILGWLHQSKDDDSEDKNHKLTESIVNEYIQIIRLCLNDMILRPSLDGIRCLLLLSCYMDSTKLRESGYCLIQLASRQAICMGLNRPSVHNSLPDETFVEELRLTWLLILKHEISISIQVGRSSCLFFEDINVDNPKQNFTDPEFYDYLVEFYKLCKISMEGLKYMRSLKSSILDESNIKQSEEVLEKFDSWYKSTPISLKIQQSSDSQRYVPQSEIKDFKLDILFKYHYFVISFTLPYLLYYLNEPNYPIERIQVLVEKCISSSIDISKLILISYQHKLFNGTLFQDYFYTYYASMGLVMGHIIAHRSEITISKEDIMRSISIIKSINNKVFGKLSGTLVKISRFISVLFSGLNILSFVTNNVYNHSNHPIIHMANVEQADFEYKPTDDDQFLREILDGSFLNSIS
ncbi:hypothetical protein CLIB1444_02S06260 [[Candida] jaroonii]|uniref:Uncharacterized protein n=1 Tax=[Candida] jaroonii TaxID=467808 RepID=A0ACA9Y4N0_9ASCO|nr:hypothetical protein CLIB1444_02S06260 [[Candida] jaroonii]